MPSGFLIIDKPLGLSSFTALSPIKRALRQAGLKTVKVGHAGTLDPLASGILTVAVGRATKHIHRLQDATKDYRFTIRWGIATATEDTEGDIIAQSDVRPAHDAIIAMLPQFTGTIAQIPSSYSAMKIDGQRAYALARAGQTVTLQPRPVEIHALQLLNCPDAEAAEFTVTCGKGTYVRALARDLAVTLGTCGHLTALRRTRVGPFDERDAVDLFSEPLDWPALAKHLQTLPEITKLT